MNSRPEQQSAVNRSSMVGRLGKNQGGYRGQGIDLKQWTGDLQAAIAGKNWAQDEVELADGEGASRASLVALRRLPAGAARRRIYLSAGIHGDEPAGPLAMLELLAQDRWPLDCAFWICPCLNPTGFPINRRENRAGIDLNRDYRHLQSAEVRAHVAWLEKQPPFDLVMCLHEDWEAHGFYVYELNPEQKISFAEKIIARVSQFCPIDSSPQIDEWAAHQGIIRPPIVPAERPQWGESLYMITHKTRQSYTLEAPSDFPLPIRVAALVTAVRTVLESI